MFVIIVIGDFIRNFLFQKYSIDEGEDPGGYEFGSSDEIVEDDSASGSSFSEASSIEDSDSSEVEKITACLQPAVQKRVDAWTKNGINLQLKTVDPSVTIDEWLKANQECTTTTKNYKKTVVNEDNKTITTTMKQTKTTTKKTSFNSFVPRLMGIQEARNHRINDSAIKPSTICAMPSYNNDVPDTDSDGKKMVPEKRKKTKKSSKSSKDVMRIKEGGLPVTIDISRLAAMPVTKNQAEGNIETFKKPKQPHKKQSEQPDHKEPEKQKRIKPKAKKILKSDAMPLVKTTRCLRSRLKENIVVSEKDETTVAKQPKATVKNSRSKKGNHMELRHSNDLPSTSVVPFEKKSESTQQSRPPLKERAVNQREDDPKFLNAIVAVKRLPPRRVTTRRQAQIQNILIEQNLDNGTTVTHSQLVSDSVSSGDFGGPDTNSHVVSNNNSCDFGVRTSTANRFRQSKLSMKNVRHKRQIVIHSPNSETILGTKVDSTHMLVTKNDYEKHIDPKHLRKTDLSFMNDSVVPINRRIVYRPPANDTINENTDYDSECEDVLVTSYMNSGQVFQLKV